MSPIRQGMTVDENEDILLFCLGFLCGWHANKFRSPISRGKCK